MVSFLQSSRKSYLKDQLLASSIDTLTLYHPQIMEVSFLACKLLKRTMSDHVKCQQGRIESLKAARGHATLINGKMLNIEFKF